VVKNWNNGILKEWNDGFGEKRDYWGMFTQYSNIPCLEIEGLSRVESSIDI
jgi:hypothetical protein